MRSPTSPVLVLVGPPGAGKSTVGRLVAERLRLTLRDTDAEVEEAAGSPVADIFLDEGEERFRSLERAAVRGSLAEHCGVLAVGGGAVLDPELRQLLRGHRVIFLRVGLADAVRRLGLARDRPVALGSPRAQLLTLLREREPLYDEVAVATVDTDGRTPAEVAEAVIAARPGAAE